MAFGVSSHFECVAGADPEMRFTPQGKAVTELRVAVREGNKGDESDTRWIRLTFWERAAEVVNGQIVKGDRLYIVEAGEQEQFWDDKDGNKRSKIVYNVRQFYKIAKLDWSNSDGQGESKPSGNQRQVSSNKGSAKPATSASRAKKAYDEDDDIPF
jgi:single-strand DNA-binding protein